MEEITKRWYEIYKTVISECLQEASKYKLVYIENFEVIPEMIDKHYLAKAFNADFSAWKMQVDMDGTIICENQKFSED